MLRKVYLEGEIGDKFGNEWEIEAKYIRDVFKCIECNVPDFRQYLVDCHEKGVGFTINVANEEFLSSEEQLLISLKPGDIVITSVPAGASGNGVTNILAAAALTALLWWNPALLAGGSGIFGSYAGFGGFLAGANFAGLIVAGVAVNLALTGIQQLMAPDPATDNSREDTYLFNGSEQNIVEGDPVPVLYGQLRVPGRPISFDILNEEFRSTKGGQGVY